LSILYGSQEKSTLTRLPAAKRGLANLLFFILKISNLYNKDGATCRVVAEGEA
jgi:hypothetical protein